MTCDLVVVGLGYVGLPLAREAVRAGLSVRGLDRSSAVVEGLAAGRSHVDDVADDDVRAMLDGGFVAVTDPGVLGEAATVVICVPTPLDDKRQPDLGAVIDAAGAIAARAGHGTLVVLESTTYPGTTDEVVRPLLEVGGRRVGIDLHLAFSPERIDPGNPAWGLRNTPKVVGGTTPSCTAAAVAFYERIVDRVVVVAGTREAEMAKLLENTYRHVNIALVNEMKIFCDELGIDLWAVIDAAATKPFGFQAFHPGPGVGGHCIPIDPNYLSYRVRQLGYPFRFVELAQEINERMPAYVTQRVQRLLNDDRKAVNGSRVLVAGVTYKADIADERESPARPVARRLRELGAELSYHDPFVADWAVDGVGVPRIDDLDPAALDVDVVVVLQHHHAAHLDKLVSTGVAILDTRGRLTGDGVERL